MSQAITQKQFDLLGRRARSEIRKITKKKDDLFKIGVPEELAPNESPIIIK